MSIQTEIRLKKTQKLIEGNKILEIGIQSYTLSNGKTLDFRKELNPDILCDLNKEKIPCKDNEFECIIAGEVLEHLDYPQKSLEEFYRILKDNGKLILSVPNVCSLINRINMIRGKLPSGCANPINKIDDTNHVNDFNKEVLIEILERVGFTIEIITSNGIISKGQLLTSRCPSSLGETLIIRAKK